MIPRNNRANPLMLIVSILLLVLFFMGMSWLLGGLYSILKWAAPVLFVLIAIIDYKVIVNYGNWLIKKFKRNFLSGVIYAVLTFVGFPFVLAWLLFKASATRFIRAKLGEFQGSEPKEEYTEFEILDSDIHSQKEEEIIIEKES